MFWQLNSVSVMYSIVSLVSVDYGSLGAESCVYVFFGVIWQLSYGDVNYDCVCWDGVRKVWQLS